ncbi:MAG: hypothetical protein U0990_12670, partial [Candidatus Nanopelagicales bacterium]|nr:hypothetical protein [Candidatus Nanopelagicales bacterium]
MPRPSGASAESVNIGTIATGNKILLANSSGVVVGVFDFAGENGLAVAIVDADGIQITSFGGGTQYTEDAAAAADPVGTALIMVRDDALSGQTTTDGDNVAA